MKDYIRVKKWAIENMENIIATTDRPDMKREAQIVVEQLRRELHELEESNE